MWVSLEDVTYFGSGLKGEFYVSENNKAPMPKLNSRQETLIAFHKAMQEPLAGRNNHIEYPLLNVLLNVSSGLIPTILYPIEVENPDLENFLRAVKDGELGLFNIEKIESFYADDIQGALSYPLYPASWEKSPAMNDLRKLLIFKGISQSIRSRLSPAITSFEKFYTVFLSGEAWVKNMRKTLSDDCPGMIAIHEYGFDSVESDLKQIGYKAQVFYAHIHTDIAQELIDRILIPIKSANPDARIFVATRGLIPESLKVFARSYTNTNVAQRTGPKESLLEIIQSSIRRDYYEWQDKQALQPHYAQKPERPEKLKVLLIDDDIRLSAMILGALKGILGEDEYEIEDVLSAEEAKYTMEDKQYDVIVYDWTAVRSDKNVQGMLLNSSAVLILSTGLWEFDIEKETNGSAFLKRSAFVQKTYGAAEKIVANLRACRKQQLEQYEQEVVGEGFKPSPTKDAIFIVNHNHQEARDLEAAIKEKTGETREIVIIGSLWELERGLKQYKPSLVITDSELDERYSLEGITNLVKDKSPDVKFIVASEFAKTLPDYIRDDSSIRAIIEKPFYFRAVLNAM